MKLSEEEEANFQSNFTASGVKNSEDSLPKYKVVFTIILTILLLLTFVKYLSIQTISNPITFAQLTKHKKVKIPQSNKTNIYLSSSQKINQKNRLKLAKAKQLFFRLKNQAEKENKYKKQLPIEKQSKQKQQIEFLENNQKIKNENKDPDLSLKDFENEQAYINADEQMKIILKEMFTRPSNRQTKPNPTFLPSQKAYFAYRLFSEPENKKYQHAEYYYYNYKYKLDSFKEQLPICIIAPGRNLKMNQQKKYIHFFKSVSRQNYTNYKLFYIDDYSDDGTVQDMREYITSNVMMKDHFNIVANQERLYALANRNKGVRKYCGQNDIVLDVDADDQFIGHQVFKFINAIFHDEDLWMSNSVFIYLDKVHKEVTTGPQDGVPQQLLRQNTYRGSLVWKTSQLRAFRANVFNKIDQNDFKDKNGKFYQWASDVFIMEPLVELCGPKHYKHFYQIQYFYNWNINLKNLYVRRHYRDIAWTQTPYKNLQTLNSKAIKVQSYKIPQQMQKQYQSNLKKALNQIKQNNFDVQRINF